MSHKILTICPDGSGVNLGSSRGQESDSSPGICCRYLPMLDVETSLWKLGNFMEENECFGVALTP